jgi:hypothetical protein
MKERFRLKQGKKELIHQHRDESGQIFGKSHPLETKHIKPSTMKAHIRTVLIDSQIGSIK